jgi:hypothetical protein
MPQTSHQNVEHSCLFEVEEFDSGHFLEMASSYLAVKALVRCRTERFVKQNVSLFSRRQEQVKIYSSAREHPRCNCCMHDQTPGMRLRSANDTTTRARRMEMTEHGNRKSSRSSRQQRLDAFEETTRFARQSAEEERRKREEKNERLRRARLEAQEQDRQV